jgi:capsular polysaccharide biosynthesis protein
MGRKAHVRLESEINQTDIAVLNPAIAPLRPVFPMLILNLILAAILGVMLGAGSALLLEISDRRVRLPGDLNDVAGVRVLAVLQQNKIRKPRRATARLEYST